MLLEVVVILEDEGTESAWVLHLERDFNVPPPIGDELCLKHGNVPAVSIFAVVIEVVVRRPDGASRPDLKSVIIDTHLLNQRNLKSRTLWARRICALTFGF